MNNEPLRNKLNVRQRKDLEVPQFRQKKKKSHRVLQFFLQITPRRKLSTTLERRFLYSGQMGLWSLYNMKCWASFIK